MSFQKAIVITTLGKRPSAIQMADVSEDGIFGDGAGTRKRRRLTHLSADEKIMRRKLKNRVAAQTARDRKKALMQELEEKVAELQEENKQLLKENAQLRLNQTAIQKENAYLKSVKTLPSPPAPAPATPPAPCKVEPGSDCPALSCKTEPECPGSAEGTDSASVSCDDALRSLCPDLKSDALLHLLEEFCGEGGEFLQSETQAGQACAATLGQLGVVDGAVGEVSPATGVVGSPPAHVDSINELIQADHQYHKEQPRARPRPLSGSTCSVSLLDGRQVPASLPSGPLLALATQPTVQSAPAMTPATPHRSPGTEGRASKLGSATSVSVGNKMSMVTMVDPNMVYSPKPRVVEPPPVDTCVPDVNDSDFLPPDMLESLDGLLSFEDLSDFSLLDQKTQQTVITSPTPPSAKTSKASQRRQTPLNASRAKAQPPASMTSETQKAFSLPGAECGDGYLSPDSGFTSDGSEGSADLSDSSPSPASLHSPDMEGLSWQEDFISVSLDLFPDVGMCV